jgi:predicted metal-binding membrane protein
MNHFWIAAFAILVLLEKVMPAGRIVGRLCWGRLLAAGGWMLIY